MTYYLKIKGSNPAIGTHRGKYIKRYNKKIVPSSTAVYHLTHYPKIEGSNLVIGTEKEKKDKKYNNMTRHSGKTRISLF